MINRKNLWFLTLFSLILILGIYYVTLPSDIFKNDEVKEVNTNIEIELSENDKLVSLRVERDEQISEEMNKLQEKITSESISTEERNVAFEELQILNLSKGKELLIEDKLKSEFNINSFVEINGNNIKITISSTSHDKKTANDIMRSVQEEFESKMNISIKFE